MSGIMNIKEKEHKIKNNEEQDDSNDNYSQRWIKQIEQMRKDKIANVMKLHKAIKQPKE